MGREVDLLANYPKTKRNLSERAAEKTEEDRRIAREFGKEFFDGDRKVGYGGYYYNPRFWQPVIPVIQQFYGLTKDSKVLDVGAGKGFMLHDFLQLIPGITVAGIDISDYAIENCLPEVKDFLQVADARSLPYKDNSFDLVLSINTVHNLERPECAKALREIQRVTKKDAFITVDGYTNNAERQNMDNWNLTAKTYMHVDEWKAFFDEIGYEGDFFWFIP